MVAGLRDVRALSHRHWGLEGTFRTFTVTPDRRIDYPFQCDFPVGATLPFDPR